MESRSHLKKRILVQDQGGRGFQTADILTYFEDLKPAPNTEIGPKDFFEMASKIIDSHAHLDHIADQHPQRIQWLMDHS